MASNKLAQVRYNILDSCFSNFNRLYSYEDLLEEVNAVLYEMNTEGVKLRQLQYDIEHMKSAEGWSIELEDALKKGRKKAFRYVEKNFTISLHPLNVDEKEQLEVTLSILSRYQHREEFNWLQELIPRMQQAFDLQDQGQNGVISYEENIYLVGRQHLGVLFNCVLKRKKIKIKYKPFHKNSNSLILSPFHLKQFNNRWFLFAKHPDFNNISNYPLDRIESIEELSEAAETSNIEWQDYFEDIIGVTIDENNAPTEIVVKVEHSLWPYIETKPLHGSQKVKEITESYTVITLELIPNYEFESLLFQFGEKIEVISPISFRDKIKQRIIKLNQMYNCAE